MSFQSSKNYKDTILEILNSGELSSIFGYDSETWANHVFYTIINIENYSKQMNRGRLPFVVLSESENDDHTFERTSDSGGSETNNWNITLFFSKSLNSKRQLEISNQVDLACRWIIKTIRDNWGTYQGEVSVNPIKDLGGYYSQTISISVINIYDETDYGDNE